MKHVFSLLAISAIAVLLTCCNNAEKQTASQEQTAEAVDQQSQSPAQPVIGEAGKAQVVDFYATWCGPCKSLAPILEQMEKKYGDKVIFTRVDIDQFPELAQKYGVEAVPTLLYIDKNGESTTTVGLLSEQELESNIKELVE